MWSFIKRIFIWWHGHTIGTALQVWRKGEKVGEDLAGNRYFREKKGHRRWVLYDGEAEASKVPPEWHAWLHYTVDETPLEKPLPVKAWEKAHVPNQTGTEDAWVPPGSLIRGGKRDKATGDYEAWKPE